MKRNALTAETGKPVMEINPNKSERTATDLNQRFFKRINSDNLIKNPYSIAICRPETAKRWESPDIPMLCSCSSLKRLVSPKTSDAKYARLLYPMNCFDLVNISSLITTGSFFPTTGTASIKLDSLKKLTLS